ncbi:MAG: hypothetical protein JWR63_1890 [Conexibacter sp.]|nr:hypothetical protein [Conexibacter sp.]
MPPGTREAYTHQEKAGARGLNRAGQTLEQARIERAVQILRAAGWNARYARYKVTMLRRAGRHLSRANLGLPVLVAAVVVYACVTDTHLELQLTGVRAHSQSTR